MSRILAAIYDRFMGGVEEACLRDWRAELLGGLSGEVLEVGAGTGLNLPHYPAAVTRLCLTEPDRHMRARLLRKIEERADRRIESSEASIEKLPFDGAAFDAVVVTLVLCSVTEPAAALGEMRRVLKPGGTLVYLEHVAARDNPGRLVWQRRIEPFWKRIAGNCHLARRTTDAIVLAGFEIERERYESMRKAWSLARPSIRGVARKVAGRVGGPG